MWKIKLKFSSQRTDNQREQVEKNEIIRKTERTIDWEKFSMFPQKNYNDYSCSFVGCEFH